MTRVFPAIWKEMTRPVEKVTIDYEAYVLTEDKKCS